MWIYQCRSSHACWCSLIHASHLSVLVSLAQIACWCKICALIPASALSQQFLFSWLFARVLQVQLYAGADIMMLAPWPPPCLHYNACRCNICSPISLSVLPPKIMFSWLFWRCPSRAIICCCKYMDASAHTSIVASHPYWSAWPTMPANATLID